MDEEVKRVGFFLAATLVGALLWAVAIAAVDMVSSAESQEAPADPAPIDRRCYPDNQESGPANCP